MNIINTHFENLVFTKVEEKEGHYIYAVKVYDRLVEKRKKYIILFVPANGFLPQTAKIRTLPWVNLQTRHIEWAETIKSQKWTHDITINPELKATLRTTSKTTYACPMLANFEISLLHDTKKQTTKASGSYQYHSTIPLSVALETYNCTVTLKKTL